MFARANNLRAQLDYITGHRHTLGEDLLIFNNLLRVFDKIYSSDNTREHRMDLQSFISLNGDAIYKKYVELTEEVLRNDSYNLKVDR